MSFSVNDPFLYLLSAIIVVFVIAQSVFFLIKASRRAQQMGIASGSGSLSGFGDGDKVSPLGGGGHGVGLRQRHFVRRQPGQPESPGQHHPG